MRVPGVERGFQHVVGHLEAVEVGVVVSRAEHREVRHRGRAVDVGVGVLVPLRRVKILRREDRVVDANFARDGGAEIAHEDDLRGAGLQVNVERRGAGDGEVFAGSPSAVVGGRVDGDRTDGVPARVDPRRERGGDGAQRSRAGGRHRKREALHRRRSGGGVRLGEEHCPDLAGGDRALELEAHRGLLAEVAVAQHHDLGRLDDVRRVAALQDEHARGVVVDHRHIERVGHGDVAIGARHVVVPGGGGVLAGADVDIALHTARRRDVEAQAERAEVLDHERARHERAGVRIAQSAVRGAEIGNRVDRAVEGGEDRLERLARRDDVRMHRCPAALHERHGPGLAGGRRAGDADRRAVALRAERQAPGRAARDAVRHRDIGKREHEVRPVRRAEHARIAACRRERLAAQAEAGRLRCGVGESHADRERRAVLAKHDHPAASRSAGHFAVALQVDAAHRDVRGERRDRAAGERELGVGEIVGRGDREVAETINQRREGVGDRCERVGRQNGVARR